MTNDDRNAANIQYFTNCQFGQNNCSDQYNKGNNTHNCYNNNNNGYKPWQKKCYIYKTESCRSNKHLNYKQQKAKKL